MKIFYFREAPLQIRNVWEIQKQVRGKLENKLDHNSTLKQSIDIKLPYRILLCVLTENYTLINVVDFYIWALQNFTLLSAELSLESYI